MSSEIKKETPVAQARDLIRFYLRQMDGGRYPARIGYSPALAKWVDAGTAQRIYEEELGHLAVRPPRGGTPL